MIPERNDEMGRRAVQVTGLVTALILIAMGLAQGDGVDVLRKATRVCMECIGLG